MLTLHVGHAPDIRFDGLNVHHIHTKRGVFYLRSSALVSTSFENIAQLEQGVYGFSEDHTWITIREENLLWIPLGYRTSCVALFATYATTTVAIGCLTGRVLFLTLPNERPADIIGHLERHNRY